MPWSSIVQRGLAGHRLANQAEVAGGRPLILDIHFRQRQAEVLAKPSLQRQVREHLVLPRTQIVSRRPFVSNEFNWKQDKGRLPDHFGPLILEPLEEANREKEHIDALFLFCSSRIPRQLQQPLLQGIGSKRRVQKAVREAGFVHLAYAWEETEIRIVEANAIIGGGFDVSLRCVKPHFPPIHMQNAEYVVRPLVHDRQEPSAPLPFDVNETVAGSGVHQPFASLLDEGRDPQIDTSQRGVVRFSHGRSPLHFSTTGLRSVRERAPFRNALIGEHALICGPDAATTKWVCAAPPSPPSLARRRSPQSRSTAVVRDNRQASRRCPIDPTRQAVASWLSPPAPNAVAD